MDKDLLVVNFTQKQYVKLYKACQRTSLKETELIRYLVREKLNSIQGESTLVFTYDISSQEADEIIYKKKIVRVEQADYEELKRLSIIVKMTLSNLVMYWIEPMLQGILESEVTKKNGKLL